MASEDESMEEENQGDEEEELEPKRVIAVRQPRSYSEATRDDQGRLKLKCVQVSDPHTTNEDDSAVMRTLRRGDCCFIQGEGPEVPGKQPATPDPVHLAIVQDIVLEESSNRVWLAVRWLYRHDEIDEAALGGVPPEEREQLVFYSTWDDEVDAATVLHPAKVWFLRSNAKEKGLLPMIRVPANGGAAAHARRCPGFLCLRSWDHESKVPRLQDFPLKSSNESGRQIELDSGMREMVRLTKVKLNALAARNAAYLNAK